MKKKALVLLTAAAAIAPLFAEDYISMQNLYAPPERGANAGGQWSAGYGLGGLGMGAGFPTGGGFGGGMVGAGDAPGNGPQNGMPDSAPGAFPAPGTFSAPMNMQQGWNSNFYNPPMDTGCVYDGIIQSLHSGMYSSDPNMQGRNRMSGGDLRSDQVLQDSMSRSMAEIEAQRQQNTYDYQTKKSQLDRQLRDLQNERSQLSMIMAPTPQQQQRMIEIDSQIMQLNAQESALQDKYDSNEYFLQNRRMALENNVQQVHPVLLSIYRNQDAIAGDGSLRPLAHDLVSYAGFTAGGPAGLVLGSVLGSFFGGTVDGILTKARDALNKPQLEEIVPLLQDICRWRKLNETIAKTVTDQQARATRRVAREDVVKRINRAEAEVSACAKEVDGVSQQMQQLDSLAQVLTNRVKQGKLSLNSDWTKIGDLAIPEEVARKLKQSEDTSVSGLIHELLLQKMSRSQFVRAYSKDNVQLNLGLLAQIRKTAEASIGNPSPEDSEHLQMILMAAGNRLKVQELELQRKLIEVLDVEKKAAIQELKNTYKPGTAALTSSMIQVELPYVQAMRELHERSKKLEDESAPDQQKMLDLLNQENERLKQIESESPLRAQASAPDADLMRAAQTAPVCSAEETQRGCKPSSGAFGWFKSCKCS